MGLPIGVGLSGIGLSSALVVLASHLMEVPDFAPTLGLLIGLGVGIDYALLIVTRYREQRHAGHDVREAIAIAMDTAGRAVVFAGATVVISLLGMVFIGIGFVGGMGIAASITVAITVAASITLLPALPGFAGDNDESNFANDTTTKRAYDLTVEGFGRGSTGPLYLAAAVHGNNDVAALSAVNDAVAADPDVESILGPQPNDAADPTAVRWFVRPKGGPQDEATTQLVH